jgi:predicted nucleotide-binding protein
MAGGETNLTDGQRAALEVVYDVFHEQAEWPSYAFVDRRLHQARWQADDVLASIPLEWVQFDRYHPRPSRVALTVAGIAALDDTAEELGLFVDAVRWLAREESEYEPPTVTDAGQLTLSSEDFQQRAVAPLPHLELVKLLELLRVEWLTTSSSGPGETEPVWQVTVDERVRPYAGVSGAADYLAVKRAVAARAAQETPGFYPVDTQGDGFPELLVPSHLVTVAEGVDAAKVFVVHGRNEPARVAMFEQLRAFGLHPLEWEELRAATGKPTPYIGEILEAGFRISQACVVLMTPDEEVRLREEFVAEEAERIVSHQPRPNVLLEAGMALMSHPDRTLIVELGRVRQLSDLAGRHVLRMNDSIEKRKELAARLEAAGCPVALEGTAWQSAGRFEDAVGEPPPSAPAPVDTAAERERSRLKAWLRQEYILTHEQVSAGILDGTEPLPAEWVARRLAELGGASA